LEAGGCEKLSVSLVCEVSLAILLRSVLPYVCEGVQGIEDVC